MNQITELKFRTENKEEFLPGFAADFPYIASCAKLDNYPCGYVPWHWHRAVELFYMETGAVEYHTPNGKVTVPAGFGGFVNSNVLHMTRPLSRKEKNTQLLHIFDPSFISGTPGSRIEQNYVLPVTASQKMAFFLFRPDIPVHAEVLEKIRKAFAFSDREIGYEIKIRESLSEIWLIICELFQEQPEAETDITSDRNDERLKKMMIYIHEHY